METKLKNILTTNVKNDRYDNANCNNKANVNNSNTDE